MKQITWDSQPTRISSEASPGTFATLGSVAFYSGKASPSLASHSVLTEKNHLIQAELIIDSPSWSK